jgi:hypothetical protein
MIATAAAALVKMYFMSLILSVICAK